MKACQVLSPDAPQAEEQAAVGATDGSEGRGESGSGARGVQLRETRVREKLPGQQPATCKVRGQAAMGSTHARRSGRLPAKTRRSQTQRTRSQCRGPAVGLGWAGNPTAIITYGTKQILAIYRKTPTYP